jgi:uncharacterized membrane protein
MCCCGIVFQEFRYRFQGFAVVLFFKNLDVVFKVLLWSCFQELRCHFQGVAVSFQRTNISFSMRCPCFSKT